MPCCREGITLIRSGYPAGISGPSFFLPEGTHKNPVYTDEFLERNGAAKFSSVVMTPSAFLTKDSWRIIVPKFIKGIRYQVVQICAKYGVSEEKANRLLVGVFFDGFKIHTEEELKLVEFAENNCLCACENRDSSEMNQAFDKWVAKAGKKRGAELIDMLRRSHIDPIINKWTLVMIGLAMLRDCDESDVWESSFIAVNMHPLHRLSFEDWMHKMQGFIRAADKFDDEVIDLSAMLPKSWLKLPAETRKTWLAMIADHNEEFDVDLIHKLRKHGMTLSLVTNIFRIYQVEKKIANGEGVMTFKHDVTVGKSPVTPALQTAAPATTPKTPLPKQSPKPKRQHAPIIYHLFKVPKGVDMKPLEKLEHAITVRNRTLGPKRGTQVSPYLDCEITPDNQRMLKLGKDDLNMYNVLQQSTCRPDVRRKVARRTLTALGGVSGMCRLVNGPEQLKKLKVFPHLLNPDAIIIICSFVVAIFFWQANLQFAESIEQVRAAEKALRAADAEAKKKAALVRKKNKEARLLAKEQKMKGDFDRAMTKLGLKRQDTVYQQHVDLLLLTGPQLKAVAHFQAGKTLKASCVADMRDELRALLPNDTTSHSKFEQDGIPEHPTQDPLFLDPGSDEDDNNSSEETTATELIDFDHLFLGDIVEVYWQGEKTWFEGVITDVDSVDRTFEVLYKSDSEKFWHSEKDYPVRDKQ